MKSCLILGGAGTIWTDAADALELGRYDLTIAINDIGARWSDPIDIWCSLHPDKLAGWRADRARAGYPPASRHIAHQAGEGIEGLEYRFPGQPSSGSSGLFAVNIAMDEGCDRIVLAGVPMTAEAGHVADGRLFAKECSVYLPAWQWALPILRGKVKSISGWTADNLGKPDAEWLNG